MGLYEDAKQPHESKPSKRFAMIKALMKLSADFEDKKISLSKFIGEGIVILCDYGQDILEKK